MRARNEAVRRTATYRQKHPPCSFRSGALVSVAIAPPRASRSGGAHHRPM